MTWVLAERYPVILFKVDFTIIEQCPLLSQELLLYSEHSFLPLAHLVVVQPRKSLWKFWHDQIWVFCTLQTLIIRTIELTTILFYVLIKVCDFRVHSLGENKSQGMDYYFEYLKGYQSCKPLLFLLEFAFWWQAWARIFVVYVNINTSC